MDPVVTLSNLENNLRSYTDQIVKPLIGKIPTVYFAYKNSSSNEIIYVSFDTVPNVANDAYITGSLGIANNIRSTLGIQKLIREGETSEFTKISDTSFSIKYEDKGVITYEKVEISKPFTLDSDIEENKEIEIDFNNFTPETLEITPSNSNKAMRKTTISFGNYVDRFYCWENYRSEGNHYMYTTFPDTSKSNGKGYQTPGGTNSKNSLLAQKDISVDGDGIYVNGYASSVYFRYPDGDIKIKIGE